MTLEAPTDELLLELDGPTATPDEVDSVLLLRLALTSFDLTARIAAASKLGQLKLAGLRVYDKCVAIATSPNNASTARIAASRLAGIISGRSEAPEGIASALQSLRSDLRSLGDNTTASIRFAGDAYALSAPPVWTPELPWERTELRVIPIRVGGGVGPEITARLASFSEPTLFTVTVSADHARALGAVLRMEIDVELAVCRDVDGSIESGRVLDVRPLADGDPVSIWREWFAEHADDWNEVEDVGEALGRY